MDAINRAVLAAIAGDVLDPALAEDIVQSARELHKASIAAPKDHERIRRDLDAVLREQARLAEVVAEGADAPAIMERLKATE
jgi:hypothetical protein